MSRLTDRQKFRAVAAEQWAQQRPVVVDPRRITIALDWKGLDGPEVDEACGVKEPTVDQWETGEQVPTPEQLQRLADLCGVTPAFFDVERGVMDLDGGFICIRSGPGKGCNQIVNDFPADRYALAQKVAPLRKDTLF